MKVLALLFGLGTGLFFIGSFSGRKNRFGRDLREPNNNFILNILRPLSYLRPVRMLTGRTKTMSALEIEDLLRRAGNPCGIKTRDILLSRALLPFLAILGAILFYGFDAIKHSFRQLSFSEGVAVSGGSSFGMPIFVILFFTVMSFFTPQLILHYLVKRREMKVAAEQGLFSEIVFMCLKARLNLKEALEEAAKTTDYLKPYLKICLNGWPTDKIKALDVLKRGVGVAGFQVIVDLLVQVADVGDDRIADFLEKNRKIEDEIKNINISARSKVRPLLITLQMFLPFILILIVLFYPLIIQVEKLLRSF